MILETFIHSMEDKRSTEEKQVVLLETTSQFKNEFSVGSTETFPASLLNEFSLCAQALARLAGIALPDKQLRTVVHEKSGIVSKHFGTNQEVLKKAEKVFAEEVLFGHADLPVDYHKLASE